MSMNIRSNLFFWRSISTIFFLSLGAAIVEIACTLNELGVQFSILSFWWFIVIAGGVLVILGWLLLWRKGSQHFGAKILVFYQKHHPSNQILLWGLFITMVLCFSAWVIWGGYIVLNGYFVRIFFYYIVALIGMFLLQPEFLDDDWPLALMAALIITAGLYRVLAFIPQVSVSPFSLGWSEGSRYYYGSLYFSQELYAQSLHLSALHPTRYMLLAIPFLSSGLPIWAHRLWQIFLWIGLTGGTGLALAKRLRLQGFLQTMIFSIWVFLFLLQGPVYYHLSICLIIIWLGVDFEKPKQTFWVVMIASVWAGLSRINWIPVPFFLTITLYFLGIPWSSVRKKWTYILPLLNWSLGLVMATMASMAYMVLASNDLSKFGSSLTSALLWNRLWPNVTYPLGIFFGSMILTLPLLVISYFKVNELKDWFSIKKWGLAAVLLVLFIGGLVVSVKIGGGGNLHNMDAYFVILVTLGSYHVFGQRSSSSIKPKINNITNTLLIMSVVAMIIPIFVALNSGGTLARRNDEIEAKNLRFLQSLFSEVENQNEKMLFIAERQLQVFGHIPTTAFVADYEKIELMEMAMADNQTYLANFYENIANQEYAIIVSDPILLERKSEDKAFSENIILGLSKLPFRY